jgi:hypothetical protein
VGAAAHSWPEFATTPSIDAGRCAARWQARLLFSFDHGRTFSFYFLDPEGNACEVFRPTGRRPSTTNRPIDLTQPDEVLLQ